ncbi:Peptidase S24/S26A/S26B, conserved region [Rhodomicrobium vannielii ATCC 17100]|uniref:Peptidase S24/S26A/S26B, conserved region n=1 Tax=Rhodomicrobium vannielii (strain ATCC 17100 / DSM 162 / LMG 4299 / NCIMB 10020 / ATH 3.1.1) TaxID=648757 RepID=E3I5E4_RHOVT|nr:translesion error-prone DNA polymerase V autoproteolytic subunit [Rhodomicrobium vannielii]ADP71665.1 Peptidase S24/S26A/S26B, conserved region [Rhodomicrobium vannielii ATCC 17100]
MALSLFLSRVPAGFPSPADDYLEGELDLNKFLIRNPAATFYVRLSGDSMVMAGLFDGDILVVDRAISARHRHIVVAVVDGELTVKRLWSSGGVIELRSENPAYQPIKMVEGRELVIWGVVTGSIRRFEA